MPVTHKVRNVGLQLSSTDIISQHVSNTQYLNLQSISGSIPSNSYGSGDTLQFAAIPSSKICWAIFLTNEGANSVELQITPGTNTSSSLSLTPFSGFPQINYIVFFNNASSGSEPLEIKVVV